MQFKIKSKLPHTTEVSLGYPFKGFKLYKLVEHINIFHVKFRIIEAISTILEF